MCSALSRLRDILSLDGDIDVDLYDENFDDVESLDSILNRRTFRMYLESRMRRETRSETTIDVPTKEDTTEKKKPKAVAVTNEDTTEKKKKKKKKPKTVVVTKENTKEYMIGVVVMFVSHSHTFSSNQVDVWKRNICNVGAQVVNVPSKEVTHVVMCPQIQSDLKILRSLYRSRTQFNLTKRDEIHSKREFVEILRKDWDLRRDVRFVEPRWIITCLKKKRMERAAKYEWESRRLIKQRTRSVKKSSQSQEQRLRKKRKTTTMITKRMNQRIGSIDEEARKRVLRKAPWLNEIRYKIPESKRTSFMCQKGGPNMNSHITHPLNEMAKALEVGTQNSGKWKNRKFRSVAYVVFERAKCENFNLVSRTFLFRSTRTSIYSYGVTKCLTHALKHRYKRASDVFKALPVRVESISQLESLMQEDKDHGGHTFKKIGNGKMLDHVKEILNTGTMVGLKGELSHEFIRVKMLFTKIWGVGKEKAELLYVVLLF